MTTTSPNANLFAWGSGATGQLGVGTWSDHDAPTKTSIRVIQLTCGGQHTLATTEQGLVAWGSNEYGQCSDTKEGHTEQGRGPLILRPVRVTNVTQRVIDMAAGWEHSAAILANGTLHTWGRAAHHRLGPASPIQLADKARARHVACGWRHTVVLTDTGSVFAWGANRRGQLGVDAPQAVAMPQRVPVPTATAVSCGWRATFVLAEQHVYAFGCNAFQQLGRGADPPSSSEPQRVASLSCITAIAAGWTHGMALDAKGTVFTWGRADHGQQGVVAATRSLPVHRVPLPIVTDSIAAGAEHCIARAKDTHVLYAWGWNEHGTLGRGEASPTTTPQPVLLDKRPFSASLVATGGASVLAVV